MVYDAKASYHTYEISELTNSMVSTIHVIPKSLNLRTLKLKLSTLRALAIVMNMSSYIQINQYFDGIPY